MAEMNTTTADLLQQMIDIKKNTREAIAGKGVEIVGGMITYPQAIEAIPQVFTGTEIDFTRAGWLQSDSDDQNRIYNISMEEALTQANIMWKSYGDYTKWTKSYDTGFDLGDVRVRPSGWSNLVIAPMIINYEKDYKLYNGSYVDGSLFAQCFKLRYAPTIDVSNTTSLHHMFALCYSLIQAPFLETGHITNMDSMFRYCNSLTTIPQYDMSSVTNVNEMFAWCAGLTTLPRLNWSSVTDTRDVFLSCYKLKKVGGFIGLKTSLEIRNTILDSESLVNIFNDLYDWVENPDGLPDIEGGPYIYLTSVLLNKLSASQKAIAINKGWTLAY